MSTERSERSPSKSIGSQWDPRWRGATETDMTNPDVLRAAAEFFDVPDVRVIEDWGCGLGQLQEHLRPDQEWIGVDGSTESAAIKVEALESYQSSVDAIYCRGVLEHNDAWKLILENFLASWQRRAVLVFWLPFVYEHHVNVRSTAIVHRFERMEIEPILDTFYKSDSAVRMEEHQIDSHKAGGRPETVFYFERD